MQRLFTDRVLLDVPIRSMAPGDRPVVDMDTLLVEKAKEFFGNQVRDAQTELTTIRSAKAFPKNVELAFEVPVKDGRLRTLHYSISLIPDDAGYEPREADQRVGYFTTSYKDLGKVDPEETRVRHLNRWHLEKADPTLDISLPAEPIVFYIEHTTPVRYRRWVRRGILYWNEAFKRVGLSDPIEVRYQNARSGADMEKDPEDVRYFVRWLNNDAGTAIGPSRVHPKTGQILDADIILTDGWIRYCWRKFNDVVPDLAMQGFTRETRSWLTDHPDWDPRVRMAPPSRRKRLLAEREEKRPATLRPFAKKAPLWLDGRPSSGGRRLNGFCVAGRRASMGVALMRMHRMIEGKATGEEKEGSDSREDLKDEPFAGSVMDYLPVNIRMESGETQSNYAMRGVGPYDKWAIGYGYSLRDDPKAILDRVADPKLKYATDADARGPDPLARRYDLGKDPLAYATEQMRLVRHHREHLPDNFVEEGESWAHARRGYEMTLAFQTRALSMMANWLGGAFIRRDKKGDPDARVPVDVVSAEKQRRALAFVVDNAFPDEAFGLTRSLLRRMTSDR